MNTPSNEKKPHDYNLSLSLMSAIQKFDAELAQKALDMGATAGSIGKPPLTPMQYFMAFLQEMDEESNNQTKCAQFAKTFSVLLSSKEVRDHLDHGWEMPACYLNFLGAEDDFDRPGWFQESPLHAALMSPAPIVGETNMVERLIKAGASVNPPTKDLADKNPTTPLMFAAYTADHETMGLKHIEILLAHGADVSARDQENQTVLHWLAACPSEAYDWGSRYFNQIQTDRLVPAATLLIEQGADPNVQNKDGQTPAMLAEANGWVDLAVLFQSRAMKNTLSQSTKNQVDKKPSSKPKIM